MTPVVGALVNRTQNFDHACLLIDVRQKDFECSYGLHRRRRALFATASIGRERHYFEDPLILVDRTTWIREMLFEQLTEFQTEARFIFRERGLFGAPARK